MDYSNLLLFKLKRLGSAWQRWSTGALLQDENGLSIMAEGFGPSQKIPKNLPIYPLYLGEAPQLFAFVLVLSISR